jgi:hypothetical protein
MIHPLNDTSLGCRQARETVPLTNKKSAVTLHPWTMRPWIIRPWKNWMMRPLDYASLGLCVPRTFCPWPFCDNLSPFFGSDHTSPFWKVWTFHPWTVENHCPLKFRHFVTKVSLHFWNLRKKTDLLIPNIIKFCEKKFRSLLSQT